MLMAPLSLAAGYGKKSTGTGTAGNNSNTNNNNNTPPPPVDHSASIEAKKKLAEATADANKANRAASDIVAALRRDFQQKPEWTAAQTALKDDQGKFDLVHDGTIAKLQRDPKYTALKTARLKAEAERDAMLKEGRGSAEDQKRAIDAVFIAAEAFTKMENAALASDPAVTVARDQLAEDNKKAAALLAQFDAIVKQNPDWLKANQEVEQKQQAVADARKTLTAALATEAQAERDRQKAIAGR
jgi:hypothetical protein